MSAWVAWFAVYGLYHAALAVQWEAYHVCGVSGGPTVVATSPRNVAELRIEPDPFWLEQCANTLAGLRLENHREEDR